MRSFLALTFVLIFSTNSLCALQVMEILTGSLEHSRAPEAAIARDEIQKFNTTIKENTHFPQEPKTAQNDIFRNLRSQSLKTISALPLLYTELIDLNGKLLQANTDLEYVTQLQNKVAQLKASKLPNDNAAAQAIESNINARFGSFNNAIKYATADVNGYQAATQDLKDRIIAYKVPPSAPAASPQEIAAQEKFYQYQENTLQERQKRNQELIINQIRRSHGDVTPPRKISDPNITPIR